MSSCFSLPRDTSITFFFILASIGEEGVSAITLSFSTSFELFNCAIARRHVYSVLLACKIAYSCLINARLNHSLWFQAEKTFSLYVLRYQKTTKS